MKNTSQEYLNDYDLEPVKYCPRCYSLRIGSIEGVEDSEYCMKCGCSEIEETGIDDWEHKYEERYGHKFVKRNTCPERTLIYGKSLAELKQDLYNDSDRMSIIKTIYRDFPQYLTPADTVLLFFDKLCKDGRINDFRESLVLKLQREHRLRV